MLNVFAMTNASGRCTTFLIIFIWLEIDEKKMLKVIREPLKIITPWCYLLLVLETV